MRKQAQTDACSHMLTRAHMSSCTQAHASMLTHTRTCALTQVHLCCTAQSGRSTHKCLWCRHTHRRDCVLWSTEPPQIMHAAWLARIDIVPASFTSHAGAATPPSARAIPWSSPLTSTCGCTFHCPQPSPVFERCFTLSGF